MRSAPLLALAVALAAACGKGKTPSAASAGDGARIEGGDSSAAAVTGDAVAPDDPRAALAWAAARDGDPEELMRLADLVGCEGLRAGAAEASQRLAAVRAAQYCHDFSALPWLAGVGADGPDDEARGALESVHELAARPRRSVDPEDADELHSGCAALLALAHAVERPRDRRALAIGSLRMLADYGCVKSSEIPADLDAK